MKTLNRSKWWWRKKKGLSCQQVGMMLQAYLDTELTDDDRVRVAGHLEACRDCGLEASTYQRIKAALAQPVGGDVDGAAIERLREFGQTLTEDGDLTQG